MHASEDSQVLHKKRDRKEMVLYLCSLAFIFLLFYNARSRVDLPHIVGNVKSPFLTFGIFLLAGYHVPLQKHEHKKVLFLLL